MARDRRPLWPANQPPQPHNSTVTPALHPPHPLPASTPAESFKLFNDHLAASRGHMQSIDEALRSLNRGPRVLETRTFTIPTAALEQAGELTAGAVGVWTADRYRIPFAAIAIENASQSAMIVTTGPAQSSAPGGGQGQVIVPPTSYAAWNMTGSQLSIYGTPGAQASLTVFADSVMPYACDLAQAAALFPGGASFAGHGAQTSPGAGANIAQVAGINLVAGMQYLIEVSYYVNGTVASPADDDNMNIKVNNTQAAVLPVDGASPGIMPPQVRIYSPPVNGTNAITVSAIAAATAGAIYHATLVVTPLVAS